MEELNVRIKSEFTHEVKRDDAFSIALVSSMTPKNKRKILLGWFIHNSQTANKMASNERLCLSKGEKECIFSSKKEITPAQQSLLDELKTFKVYEKIVKKLEQTLQSTLSEKAASQAW